MTIPQPKSSERRMVHLVWALVLGLILMLAWQRLQMESRPRTVELAFPEARLIEATSENPRAPDLLLTAGVTTLVRKPYTLDSMIRYGLAGAWQPKPARLEIRTADKKLASSAAMYLTGQLGMSAVEIRWRETEYILDVQLPEAPRPFNPDNYILEIPVGPMPAGYRRALWLPAGDWGATRDLDQLTQAIFSLKPQSVIPVWQGGAGARAFYRSYANTPWLRKPLMVIPEFNLPWRARGLVRRQSQPAVVRAHIITANDKAWRSPQSLHQRLVRAVRERSLDWLYVEPPPEWTFARCLEFIRNLHGALLREGFEAGAATPPRRIRTGHVAVSFIYLGVGALFFVFLWQVALWMVGFTGQDEDVDSTLTIRLRPSQFRWAALFLVSALLILHWQGSPAWGSKVAAWLVALMAPLFSLGRNAAPAPAAAVKGSAVWIQSGKEFFTICGWNLAAGLCIAVLLYQTPFILRLDSFAGVKAAYLLPLLAAWVMLFPSFNDPQWWQERWRGNRRIWMVGTVLVVGLGLLLLVVRSGNVSGFPLSTWETQVRDSLESLLGVRPRFKEFLIGHPLLWLGLAGRRLTARTNAVWPDVCLAVGLVGQVSMINTFCHIHTPLALSLLRTVYGIGLGSVLGSGLVLAASWRLKRPNGAT